MALVLLHLHLSVSYAFCIAWRTFSLHFPFKPGRCDMPLVLVVVVVVAVVVVYKPLRVLVCDTLYSGARFVLNSSDIVDGNLVAVVLM